MLEPGGNVNVDPAFVDPASDLHLLASSPLVDAGDPATAAGLDFDGNALLADGNGEGSACRRPSRRNRGGKAYVRSVRIARITATLAAGAQSVRRPPVRAAGRLRPGRHRATVTATDAAGDRSAPATVTFIVRNR